jgi:hypothetical protein
MPVRARLRSTILLAAACGALACGGASRESGAPAAGGSASAGSAAQAGAIEPCRLTPPDVVANAVPNHDGGSVTHSGASLLKGVDAYQCSYINAATDLLTVIVNVAVDDERFEAIKKSSSFHSDHRTVPIGDAAWVWGEGDNVKVQVEKGRAILDVELMATGAAGRTDAVVEVARAAATKLP